MKDLAFYSFLSSFCWDEYYFPMDGDSQNFTYFPEVGPATVKDCWRKTAGLIRSGRAPRDIGLYLHWPLCPSHCGFCFCSLKVPDRRGEAAAHAAALKREMEFFKDALAGVPFTSVWFGGGTPTFMPARELDGVLAAVRKNFTIAPDAEFYVEASPATLTREKADALRRNGVNRVTLGIQSRDEGVLTLVDRAGQDAEAVERAYALLAGTGIFLDVDLMAGLPGQSRASFLRDLEWILRRGPDSLHMFAFDPRPHTRFTRDGGYFRPGAADGIKELLDAGERAVRSAGYRRSRLDPETLKPDRPEEVQDSAVRREGASVLGLGWSAVSHAFGSAWYCHPLVSESKPVRGLPPFRLMRSPVSEEARGYALRHLALFGRLSDRGFSESFGAAPDGVRGLGTALAELAGEGFLVRENGGWRYAGRDQVEKLVVLKHLYSPGVRRALLAKHGRAYEAFLKDPPPGRWPAAVSAKVDARSLFRVYYRDDFRRGGP